MADQMSGGITGGISAIVLFALLDWLKGLKKEPEIARLQKDIDALKAQKPPCDDSECRDEFAEFRKGLAELRTKHDHLEGFMKGHTTYVEKALTDGASRMDGLQKSVDSMHHTVVAGMERLFNLLPDRRSA